jgi:hypothetical protein
MKSKHMHEKDETRGEAKQEEDGLEEWSWWCGAKSV